MQLPAFLAHAADAWSAYYDAHRMVSVSVHWLHLAGLVVGGGAALVADRRVLVAARWRHSVRESALAELDGSHRVILPALAVVVLTGLLMTASDRATFMVSRLYWSKMGLVTLLLLNGTGLLAAERAARRGRAAAWSWLGVASCVSLVLWLVILFFGVWLTAAA
jgi:hypothetical protein